MKNPVEKEEKKKKTASTLSRVGIFRARNHLHPRPPEAITFSYEEAVAASARRCFIYLEKQRAIWALKLPARSFLVTDFR